MYFARAPPGRVTARPPDDRPAKAGHAGALGHGTCVGARPWAWLGARVPCSYPSLVTRRNDLDVLDYKYLSFELEFERRRILRLQR